MTTGLLLFPVARSVKVNVSYTQLPALAHVRVEARTVTITDD